MIGISALTQDASGAIVIHEDKSRTRYRENVARLDRTKTLDGGVVINHGGFADGDRNCQVVAWLTEAQENTLWNIFETHNFVRYVQKDGVYQAAIQSVRAAQGETKINMMIKEKETS